MRNRSENQQRKRVMNVSSLSNERDEMLSTFVGVDNISKKILHTHSHIHIYVTIKDLIGTCFIHES